MKKYLKKFLEELPRQTMFDQIEVVLDHNEPDPEEVAWVKEFQTKYPGRIKHIIVAKVDPIGTSMNRCIREASGKYVAIWNVDDLRTPDSIQLQYHELEKDPAVGIVYGDYRIVRSFGETQGSLVGGVFPEAELTRSMVIGPFYMFRKSLVEKSGYFDEQLRSGADFDLAIRLAFHAKAARAGGKNAALLGYYLNEGLGASTRPNSKQALERTVIELRYGIYDKIDYDLVPMSATGYNIPNIMEAGMWSPVSKYVPDYATLIEQRRKEWQNKGLRNYFWKKAFFVKQIRAKLKPKLKPIILKIKGV